MKNSDFAGDKGITRPDRYRQRVPENGSVAGLDEFFLRNNPQNSNMKLCYLWQLFPRENFHKTCADARLHDNRELMKRNLIENRRVEAERYKRKQSTQFHKINSTPQRYLILEAYASITNISCC